MQKNKENNTKTVESFIQETENHYFIGREMELEQFDFYMDDTDPATIKILNIYGTGGIGKTYLLHGFSRLAEINKHLFFHLDSRDFLHTPLTLAENLLTQIQFKYTQPLHIENFSLQNCIKVLRHLAQDQTVIIAIDSYEQMGDLDRWFRNVFLRQLPQNIIIILAGRYKLTGEWEESPAWRQHIRYMKLEDFNFQQTKNYLAQYNITDRQLVYRIWLYTKGYPLAVSLAALTPNKASLIDGDTNILNQLTKIWLLEVSDKGVQELIEAASILRQFNQSKLSYLLNKNIPIQSFNELTALSFVKRQKNGWAVHDLIRDAIKLELKNRNPDQYEKLQKYSAAYYHNKVTHTHSAVDIGEFFYHLGDDFIQSAFFQESFDSSDSTMHLEHVGEHNFN